eukprot:jgi/Botrbrau1/12057/Bobra.0295s0012.1
MQLVRTVAIRARPTFLCPRAGLPVTSMAKVQYNVQSSTKSEASSARFQASKLREGPVHIIDGGNTVTLTIDDEGEPRDTLCSFRASEFLARLPDQLLGSVLLTASELPSTQTFFQQNFDRLPDGAICVVDQQVSGKGRGGNQWTSPLGCLMFSFYKKLALPGARVPFVQYVISLAVIQAIESEVNKLQQGTQLGVKIKWPNDIYCDNLKLGGILCQTTYRDHRFHLVSGVGLNVDNRQPTTCVNGLFEAKQRAAGLPEPYTAISKEDLLAAILERLEPMLTTLETDGFKPLQEAYLASWLHSNQRVFIESGHDDTFQQEPVTIVGLSQNGYLEALDSKGHIIELHPDGNSLDFFRGLLKSKR